MKRLSAILMCVILVLSMTVVAVSAVDAHTITINSTAKNDGETYTAYKIFDVTYSATDPKSYSYTINDDSEWFSVVTSGKSDEDSDGVFTANGYKFTPIATSSNPTVYNVQLVDTNATEAAKTQVAKNLAALLYKHTAGKSSADSVVYSSTDSTKQSISVTDDGYYFVTTTLGTLCDLNTTSPNVTITEKNSDNTVTKVVKEDSDSAFYEKNDAQIGQTVEFKTTINIKEGTRNLVLHDIMDKGLTPNVDSVTVTGLIKGEDKDYTVKSATDTADSTKTGFDVTFNQTYLDKVTEDTELTVTYTAVLNKDAVIGGDGNKNTTWLTYGDKQATEKDETTTYTYEFNVLKTDNATPNANPLAGAKFELYYTADGTTKGDKVQFVETSTEGTYRVAVSSESETLTEITTGADGKITYQGLDADTYILEETEAPAGFNKLPQTITVQIAGVSGTTKVEQTAAEGSTPATYFYNGTVFQRSDGQSSTVNNPTADNVKADKTIPVVNAKGGLLPTTGGLGTTLFYTVGGLLVVGAVILLISRKRMKKSA